MSQPDPLPVSPADIEVCLRVLKTLADDPATILQRQDIERQVARVYKKARKERRRQSEYRRIQSDRTTIAQTGRVQLEQVAEIARSSANDTSAEFTPLLARSRRCYICRHDYRDVHRFYHLLCPACASLNEAKRQQVADLTNRRALVTGGRIKIGYQTALKLLRWGAQVTITTRFPNDAMSRYKAEADFGTWQHQLSVLHSDFRDVPSLLKLIEQLRHQLPSLDLLVNNAAQSVRKPPETIERLTQAEITANPIRLLNVSLTDQDLMPPAQEQGALSQIPTTVDRHGELQDQREQHGWTQRLSDLDPLELLEVLLINSNAPCLLTSGLLPLFKQSPFPDRYVINVTGLDGQFSRSKNVRHPHVNMSKAALNMLTRTSAREYARSGVYMNSVDTGWITHEGSWSRRMQMRQRGFVPPLDELDGAARILDPVVTGVNGNPTSGLLFRNYRKSDW